MSTSSGWIKRVKSAMLRGATPKYSQPSRLRYSTVPSTCRDHISLVSSSRRMSKGLFERGAGPRFGLDDIAKNAQHQIAPMAAANSPLLVNPCGNRCRVAMATSPTRLNAAAAMRACILPRNRARSTTQINARKSNFEPYMARNPLHATIRKSSLEAMNVIFHIDLWR
jgi:hypothetical protein